MCFTLSDFHYPTEKETRIMPENDRLVSVIVPVYNGKRYLGEAIESVLAQTYRSVEIIVVDDGSTDGSAQVAKRFDSVRYSFQSNSGAAAARNQGVASSQGDFLAFLDADDLWINDKLARQMAVFQADSKLDMVFGLVSQFYSWEIGDDIKRRLKIPVETLPGLHVGTMLIKREAFLQVGSFVTNWEIGEFIDWYARAREQDLKTLMLPDVVMRRRIHKTNQGITKAPQRKAYVHILKAALDRRRKAFQANDNSHQT